MRAPRKPFVTSIIAFSKISGDGQKEDTRTKRPNGYKTVTLGSLVTENGASSQPKRQRAGNYMSLICFIWVRLKSYATRKSVATQIPMTSVGRNIFLNGQLGLIIPLPNRRLVDNRTIGSLLYRGRPLKGLSPVMGNYHAGFLGGLGSAMTPGYPVFRSERKTTTSCTLNTFPVDGFSIKFYTFWVQMRLKHVARRVRFSDCSIQWKTAFVEFVKI